MAGLYASYVAWVVTVWLITDWRPGKESCHTECGASSLGTGFRCSSA